MAAFPTKRMSFKTKPETVTIGDHPMKCLVCSNLSFHRRKTHFDTALIKELNPDWTHSVGYCLICDQCGHIHWFVDR